MMSLINDKVLMNGHKEKMYNKLIYNSISCETQEKTQMFSKNQEELKVWLVIKQDQEKKLKKA